MYASSLAEFYGVHPPTANLELLSCSLAKYPEFKDRVLLSVNVRNDLIFLQMMLI